MKHRSLKWKMSLWFTLILMIVCIVIFSVMLTLYQSADRKLIKSTLTDTVEEVAFEFEDNRDYVQMLKDGDFSAFDESDFYYNDVQLMLYKEDGSHAAGVFLYDALDSYEYSPSDEPIKIELDGKNYYYYDELIKIRHGDDYYIRGVIATEDNLTDVLNHHLSILIVIPLLLLLAFVGGYFITGRFLRSIKKISRTAEEIRTSGDLTKRIETMDSNDELNELSQTINAMFEKLENDFEAQKQFSSNASHELRTPISVILAQCEYGFDNADNAEELLQVVSAVQKQGYKMSELIETLLIFTRIEQHTERYPKTLTNLTELVNAACEDFRLIAEKYITVEEKLDSGVCAVVNRELFRIMVNNLMQNAIRYGKDGGYVKAELSADDAFVKLSITDNGTGIPEQDLPHIWERFYRSDKSRSSKGLGLGLSLVRQIAEYHDGSAEVVSKENGGSCFTVKMKR